jgi:2-polyprenyl-3-methyl-5-hydroxy-6-metoxy-1,4-benzoquinol methylase
MLNFTKRSAEPEILDNFELKGHNLTENLQELEWVNRFLGGYKETARTLKSALANHPAKAIHLVDLGCGGGDSLRFLARYAQTQNLPWHFTGVDANPAALAYAEEQSLPYTSISYQQSLLTAQNFSSLNAQVVLFNLFLHHFSDKEIISFLKICKEGGVMVFINDLHRNKLAYQLFRVVSRIFRFSRISRHDGKLSVKKSFTKEDWSTLFESAGYTNYQIKWRWAFRWVCLLKP